MSNTSQGQTLLLILMERLGQQKTFHNFYRMDTWWFQRSLWRASTLASEMKDIEWDWPWSRDSLSEAIWYQSN